MSISGIAITLSEDPELLQIALRELSQLPQLTLGPKNKCKLAAVIETSSVELDKLCWTKIEQIPGVIFLELVCSYFDTDLDALECVSNPLST